MVTWVLGFVGHVGATRPPHIPARWVAGMWDSSEPPLERPAMVVCELEVTSREE